VILAHRSISPPLLVSLVAATIITGQLQAQNVVLVKTINISGSGAGPRMRMGDLNGDGRLDFVMVQATSETPSEVAMLTAYDGCSGQRLWQVGKDNGLTGTDRDEPAQIWDIDNDGENEVVAVMNTKIIFLNGATGETEKSLNMPSGYETCHDCITFANFTGAPFAPAQDIVLKDRYTRAVAIDNKGTRLWTYSGITGHYPWPFDIDGDGRDEFFIGYSCLSPTGQPKYAAPITIDHPDCIWIGDVDADPSNGWEVVYGLAENPSTQCVNTRTGKVVWTNGDRRESQQVMLADFRKDLSGLEIYGLDRVNRTDQDALFVVNAQGKQLWEETPDNSGYTTAIKLVRNWDGTNTALCLAIKRGGNIKPELRDGNGRILCSMPMDGNACVGDFGGDSRQEILMYSTSTANIYAASAFDYTEPAPTPGKPLRQPKEYGLYSRYGSGDPFALEQGTVPVLNGNAPGRKSTPEHVYKVFGNDTRMQSLAPATTGTVTLFDCRGRTVAAARIKGGNVVMRGIVPQAYLAVISDRNQ
jgi:hypothetical protein